MDMEVKACMINDMLTFLSSTGQWRQFVSHMEEMGFAEAEVEEMVEEIKEDAGVV